MKILTRLLPSIFFLLLFLLIAVIVTGFYIRNQKISDLSQKIIQSTVNIFSQTKEIEDLNPDTGFITDQETIDIEFKNLADNQISFISSKDSSPQLHTVSDSVIKTSLTLSPGINLFRLSQLDPNSFSATREIPFIFYRNQPPQTPVSGIGIYGKVISTLGGNIELKSLISGNTYTFETDEDKTEFEFVNPREENDGNQNQGLKGVEKLEVDDMVIGLGPIENSVQQTQKLISYANKDPFASISNNLKSGIVSAVDSKRESFTLENDKTKYYWDKNTSTNNQNFTAPKKGQQLLFTATANSYGNLVVRDILNSTTPQTNEKN